MTPRLALLPLPPDAAADLLPAEARAAHRLAAGHGPPPPAWLVVSRDGTPVGSCHWYALRDGAAEIGYAVHAAYRRRGYGREAVRAVAHWIAGQPGVERVVADVHLADLASRRLLERLGFAPETSGASMVRYSRRTESGSVTGE